MIKLPRRKFITGLASLIAAPAIVRASSLMQIRSLKLTSLQIVNNEIGRLGDYEFTAFDQLDILYSKLFIKPELALNLKDYNELIVKPMVQKLKTEYSN